MTEQELKKYLAIKFPKEDESCEWKAWQTLKNSIASRSGDNAISYVSAISDMKGGYLIIGVEDKTLEILGIKDFAGYSAEKVKHDILDKTNNLNSKGFEIDSITTSDSNKTIWIIHITCHQPRLPVYAHKKAWQRIGESLIEGRKGQYFLLSGIAKVLKKKAQYVKNKAFDKEHYKAMILRFLDKYKQASREEINDLIIDKLSDILSAQQKNKKSIIFYMKWPARINL